MSGEKSYMALVCLSVPRYDDEGKITNKNQFYRPGQILQLDGERHGDLLERGLKSGAIGEVDKPQEPEAPEGSEVNGPGAQTVIGTPSLDAGKEGQLVQPADDAPYAEWVAFAKQEGLDTTGGKAAIIQRADEKAKANAGASDDDSQN